MLINKAVISICLLIILAANPLESLANGAEVGWIEGTVGASEKITINREGQALEPNSLLQYSF